MPPDRHPEPGVQVGKVNQASGSSDARRSHQPVDVPSPCSMSIGSRKYKARWRLRLQRWSNSKRYKTRMIEIEQAGRSLPIFFAFYFFCQVSRKVTVRLNTGALGLLSTLSATK